MKIEVKYIEDNVPNNKTVSVVEQLQNKLNTGNIIRITRCPVCNEIQDAVQPCCDSSDYYNEI